MRHKGQLALGALLVLSLAWAYRVAHPPPDTASAGGEAVTLWKLPQREITRLTYRDGKQEVVLEPQWKAGDGTPYIWVKSLLPKGPRRGKPAKNPPLEAAAFKGNAQAEKMIEFFAGATARRKIGRLKALEAADFGFPSQERWVEIAFGSGQPARRLELGRNLYGNSGIYVHTPHDDGVYLMALRRFRQFSRAATLLRDRRLLALSPDAAARAEVSLGGRKLTLWRLAGKGLWARSSDAQEGQETAMAVMRGLAVLRVTGYLPASPQGAASTENATEKGTEKGTEKNAEKPQVEIKFFGKENGALLETLGLYLRRGNTFQARSFHTRKIVNIHQQQIAPLMKKIRELFRET